ncbi:MAG: hypothetical protein DMF59_04905 [Acidobacteria bacterium]|nr:MAG: hypothetical protein DMF59_04905 [Acidobacteriota bacterium]
MPSRSLLAIILAIGIAWQAYAISVAMRFGPPLAKFMAGLGVEPNAITRAFVATYLWWFVIPLVCAIVSIDVVRRTAPPRFYVTLVVIATLSAGFVLQAWTNEAWLSPLIYLMQAVR